MLPPRNPEPKGAARGGAEAQCIVRATLSDSYLQYLWIKTLNEKPELISAAAGANPPLCKTVGAK